EFLSHASQYMRHIVQIRGEADPASVVTVNENPTWRNGEYFYGGDYADNTAVPVFKEVEVAAVVPATSPDGWDEMSAVTGRVFVAQNPEQFTYDADGNMLTDGRFRYTWNGENRLVRAQELVAPTNRNPYTIAYAYDHRGRMVSKRITENDGNDTLVSATTYLWDGWNIIREVQGSRVRDQGSGETLVTDNVWGLDLDGTLQGAGGVGGLLAVMRSNSSTHQLFFPTYDANGNISEYISTNGEVVAHYDYSPFGETLIESGDLASSFPHRFSTKPWCPVTGLYEYQMRKYRPEIGRWLSRDSIGEIGGIHLLSAFNNLVCFFDCLGLNIYYLIDSEYLKETEEKRHGTPQPGQPTIRQIIQRAIDQMNYGLTKTHQEELLITMNIINSLTDIAQAAKNGKNGDHFILHTHGSGKGIFIGGRHYEWKDTSLINTLKEFESHCVSISFRVCNISQKQAEHVKSITGASSVYFSPDLNEKSMFSFDLVPQYDKTGWTIEKYVYDPTKGGLQCVGTCE
ncbi:MAG: RHS repeat-associated core domain-containing protein, partial [Kiritimatiellae bacterium]|nr:RHS repeat-associated core domain-containing protein [Kiritimatiellia bacterium]